MTKRMNTWPIKAVPYDDMTHDELLAYSWINTVLLKNYGTGERNGNVARLIIRLMREKCGAKP